MLFLQIWNLNVKHEAIYLMTQLFLLLFTLKYYYYKKNYFLHFKILFLMNLVHKFMESTIAEAAIALTDGRGRLFQGISRPPKPPIACIWLYI